MFVAFELRQVAAPELPAAEYVVLRGGKVFDASLPLWEQGVRWAMPASELRWHAPAAQPCDWQAELYRESQREVGRCLAQWGGRWALPDVRRGWLEVSVPTARDWQALAGMLVPAAAGWIRGGVAAHPLLAGWVARAGEALGLRVWGEGAAAGCCWVAPPEQTAAAWASFPLSAVPASLADRARWRQFHWARVGEVPGLAERLARVPLPSAPAPPLLRVERRWAEPLFVGLQPLWGELAQELAAALRSGKWVAKGLRIIWEPESAPPCVWRRQWPMGTQEAAALRLRLLSLVPPSAGPPVRVAIEVDALEAAPDPQLHWWGSTAVRAAASAAASSAASSSSSLDRWESVRERRLAMWDPWRVAAQ